MPDQSPPLGPVAPSACTTHVIHASLVRHALYAGAEPAVVMVEVAVAFALVFAVGFHVATLLLARSAARRRDRRGPSSRHGQSLYGLDGEEDDAHDGSYGGIDRSAGHRVW